jgi:predicted O-methyltransferase YrrM
LRLDREQLKITVSRLLAEGPLRNATDRVLHITAPPTLHAIFTRSDLLTASAADATTGLLGEEVDYRDEYEALEAPSNAGPDVYPDYYKVGDATNYLLYSLVRHLKPRLMVEVGVADGRSTQTTLTAMDVNDVGRLVSVDIAADVGGAARGHSRWALHVHSVAHASSQLGDLLDRIGPVDAFFHDAGHTYASQYADYLVGYRALRPGGVFISDDVDWSWAFLDLTLTHGIRPIVLSDVRKAVGLFVRPGNTPAST